MSDGRRNYQADKEKLRMAKNLVKANNKKIKGLVKDIDSFLVEKGGDDVIDNWDGQTPRTLLEFRIFCENRVQQFSITNQTKMSLSFSSNCF